MGYEALGSPRFKVDGSGPTEIIRIKARRQIFALLFLPVWLAGWTAGGIGAMTQLAHRFDTFLMFWLVGWAIGWCAATATLGWMLFGSETLRVVDRDLELGFQIGPWKRTKVYQGSQIRALRGSVQNDPFGAFRFSIPFIRGAQFGAIQFTYGARTIKGATGLDQAEGEMIVVRLAKHLPATAMN